MPKPLKRAGGQALVPVAIKDPRFASFQTAPRFRLPSKKAAKVVLDSRFKRMLKDDAFVATTRVDRYGRRLRDDSKKKVLQRLYRTEEEGEEEEEKEKEKEKEDEEEEADGQVDDDDAVQTELATAKKTTYDPARGGGFSSSEEDDPSSEDENDRGNKDPEVTRRADMQRFHDEQTEVEPGEITTRIAIVNLDWDNVQSIDLMALFSSFCPVGGRVERVAVFPSGFGKERMAAEEVSGPPKEVFGKAKAQREVDSDDTDGSKDDEDEESDEQVKKSLLQEGDAEGFDHDALRAYQLDRLRYYYAVIWCSDKATAEAIYKTTDGSELLSSSNFLDLRFVPDDLSFADDEPRDSCDKPPGASYKPVQFTTNSLSHSKVKLTWDTDPGEAARKERLTSAFTGSRKDIAENDLKAYLASDSEREEDDRLGQDPLEGKEGEDQELSGDERKLSKKEQARQKMRQALGLSDKPVLDPKGSRPDGPIGDMQITFLPVFSAKEGGAADEAPEPEETTIEKYRRKERERKAKQKDKAVAKREGRDPDAAAAAAAVGGSDNEGGEDLGFDDPFFTAEPAGTKPVSSKSSRRKEERLHKRAAREAEAAGKAEQKAQLELLMADGYGGDGAAAHLDHFDMKQIAKAEKKKKAKKGRGHKEGDSGVDGGVGELQEGFAMDLADDRFRAVFEDHEFAIDPSNPKYKATTGMKQLLEEARKKRKSRGVKGEKEEGEEYDAAARREVKRARKEIGRETRNETHSLVEAVKRKSGKS